MVKVTYECDETGQKMIATFQEGDEESTVKLDIVFEPEISEEVKDPYGVMGKVFSALSEG